MNIIPPSPNNLHFLSPHPLHPLTPHMLMRLPLLHTPLRHLHAPLPTPLSRMPRRLTFIRLVRRGVVNRIHAHDLILHRGVAVEEGAGFGAGGGVRAEAGDGLGAGGDVEAVNGAVEESEGGEGLVEGDFVAGLEDAGEGEVGGLFDLAGGRKSC